jgi:uncharacterized protein YdhG (YjbR/CyaY superfamily)
MRTDFKSVDQYLAAQPEAVQRKLGRVRSTVRKALPAAEEVISYKIPTYKLHGRAVLYFAVWKEHYSLYAATVKLIGRIAKFRAREVAQREKAKAAAVKQR